MGKPDLVWIGQGNARSRDNKYRSEIRIHVFENISTSDTVAFRDPFLIRLDGMLDRQTSYAMFHDINGDGILDFVLVESSGIDVWYGKGNYEFEREPVFIPFRLLPGSPVDLYKMRLNFHDLNGDGLPEAIVQTDTGTSIFMNQGNQFVIQDKGPLVGRSWAGHSGRPVVLDLLGTGNVQVVAEDLIDNHVHVIELSEPGTGLLKAIDDGQGNLVQLSYQRVPASPGIGYRFPVLNQMSLTVSGEGTRTERYQFSEPIHHSMDQGFLGFKTIVKESELGASQFTYQMGDQQPGVLISQQEVDFKIPNLLKVLQQGFTEVTDFGISWLRKSSILTGFSEKPDRGNLKLFSDPASAPSGSTEQTTLHFDEKSTCLSAVRVQTSRGTALYEIQYFDSPQFNLSLSCVLDHFSVEGTHLRTDIPVKEELKLVRNAQGQPLSVIRQGGVFQKILQVIDYTSDFQTQAITVPGMGRTEFQYNPVTTLLESITTPDKILRRVTRDPLHDQLTDLTEDRGNDLSSSQKFEFDPFERLSKSFEKNSSSSIIHGMKSFRYSYATPSSPGWIEGLEQVVDGDTMISRKQLDLLSGSGMELGALLQLGQVGALIQLKSKNSEQGLTIDLSSKTLNYESFLSDPSYTSLYRDTLSIQSRSRGAFNWDQKELQLHQAGVTGTKDFNYRIDSDRIVNERVENGSIKWISHSNEKGQVTAQLLPNGARYGFEYDVLGRITQIRLPSGEIHQILYNSFGEISRISRTGIGSIAYFYQPSNSLLERKDYLNSLNETIRSVLVQYDNQGRKKVLTYLDPKSHSNETFEYYYDGGLPDGSTLAGQKGRLTSLVGPLFQKTWNYREDGKILWEKVNLASFGALTTHYEYRSDGTVKTKKIARQDAQGGLQLKLNIGSSLDAFGREAQVTLNDHPLYTTEYDTLSRITAAKGETLDIQFNYDPYTQRKRGFTQNMPSSSHYSTSWDLDQRGHLIHERFSTSKEEINQSYQYSDVGYLSSYVGEKGETSYDYDENQTIRQVSHHRDELRIQSQGNRWITDTGHYELDSLGRVATKDYKTQKIHMEYGPQGRVNRTIRFPLAEVSYLYDDEGKRIIKKLGEKITEVYLGNMLLTPELLLAPVEVNGTIVGYFENESFKRVSTDMRSTVLSDDGGALTIPEPFGDQNRDHSNSSRAAFLEYSLLGYDSDLHAYRAAHRDYDPVVKRFLTPDPLFLENPEKCIESPVECNLYGYAKNNPLSFVDPTGKNAWAIGLGLGLLMYKAYDVIHSFSAKLDAHEARINAAEIKGGSIAGAAAFHEAQREVFTKDVPKAIEQGIKLETKVLQSIGNNLLKAAPDSAEKSAVQDGLKSFQNGFKASEKIGELVDHIGKTSETQTGTPPSHQNAPNNSTEPKYNDIGNKLP